MKRRGIAQCLLEPEFPEFYPESWEEAGSSEVN
ncbi:MAG: hypothetical protein ACI91J_003964, partial [Yoonia sp.]